MPFMIPNLVSLVRDLQRPHGRRRRGLAVAEGVRLVEEALAAGLAFRGALVTASLARTARGTALLEALGAHGVPVVEIAPRTMAQLSGTETPQGVLAVLEPPRWPLETIRPRPAAPVLVLDGVQDPGNVGALLRTAYALGAAGAVLLPGTADPANAKVLRGAMGATFHLPWAPATDGEFRHWVRDSEAVVWATAAEGTPLGRRNPPERLALVVGNEGAGVRQEVRELAEATVSVPLARGAESLNVAVAAGILLFWATRAS
jgi:TrmH family RNA methyltransferase